MGYAPPPRTCGRRLEPGVQAARGVTAFGLFGRGLAASARISAGGCTKIPKAPFRSRRYCWTTVRALRSGSDESEDGKVI